MNVGFVSLGCSKNLIDTEMVIGLFKKNNFTIVNDAAKAEVLIINTCGFIQAAKQEAINTILEMAEYKKNGECKYLIVMGCLVQRYKEELEKLLPEVDLFLKIDEYENIWEQISNLILEDNRYEKLCYYDRVITTGNTTTYLKIAEGCSNYCTYCAIPKIRGKYVSRPMEDILKEAELLASKGYKELIVIAQDTTKYGIDLYGELKLAELLHKISEIEGIKWVRFLYAYPESITDELIEEVKSNPKICNYFDIPIQHISDRILKLMNRKSDKKSIKDVFKKIKTQIPDAVIRTTVIVGFPGETVEDFNELYEFISEAKFDKLGAFAYSKEEGTPAEKLPNQVHYKTKKSRYDKVMNLQKSITEEQSRKHIGKTMQALVEDVTKDGKFYIARTYMDAPDVDSVTYIKCPDKVNLNLVGKFVTCTIVDASGYDFVAEF